MHDLNEVPRTIQPYLKTQIEAVIELLTELEGQLWRIQRQAEDTLSLLGKVSELESLGLYEAEKRENQ